MNKKVRMILPFAISGLFLLLDQTFKYIARTNPEQTHYIINPWLGWEYFENQGIAFSLPFPNPLLLLITPLILFFLIHTLLQKQILTLPGIYGITLILSGAISNFTDRILFGITIDYLRVATSVLNLADVMIVAGTLLVIFSTKHPIPKKL